MKIGNQTLLVRCALMTAGVLALMLAFTPWQLADAVAKAGPARIVNQQGAPIGSGGSRTVFGLQLPIDAACPGDTMHQQWLVSSFAIPESMDPARLSFPYNYPSTGIDLITTDGVPYITQATGPFTGAVVTPPLFSWSRYDHDTEDLPPGPYIVGIACVRAHLTIARYWAARVSFVTSASDPGGFTWRVTDPSRNASGGLSGGLLVLLVVLLGLLGSIAGWVVLSRRHRGASSPDSARRPGRGRRDDSSPPVHITARQS